MKLREKPREYDAIQWNGNNYQDIMDFCKGHFLQTVTSQVIVIDRGYSMTIGDWVLKDQENILYVELGKDVPGWRYENIPENPCPTTGCGSRVERDPLQGNQWQCDTCDWMPAPRREDLM